MKKGGIYGIINISTNFIYIGSTGRSFDKRWQEHKNNLNKNKHDNYYLQNAWKKYREDDFKFVILEECEKKLLIEREQYWIDFYNESCYNLSPSAGSLLGYKRGEFSEEHKAKLRLSHLGQIPWNKGKKVDVVPWNKGINLTEEHKKKLSENHSDVSGEKHPMFGKHHSEETKQKIRAARAKQVITQEQKDLMSIRMKGNKNAIRKLTIEDVKLIREKYNNGQSKYSLAKEYKVSWACIHKIVNNQTWTEEIISNLSLK